eukprot:11227799-Lingulodinium_polyedra.AAC.1
MQELQRLKGVAVRRADFCMWDRPRCKATLFFNMRPLFGARLQRSHLQLPARTLPAHQEPTSCARWQGCSRG